MADAFQEASWADDPFRAVTAARTVARVRSWAGDMRGYHATLLSGFITAMSLFRAGPYTKIKKTVFLGVSFAQAEYHAYKLAAYEDSLDHGQIDVLATWHIEMAKRIPGRKKRAYLLAKRGLERSIRATALPHQKALARITYVRAGMLFLKHPDAEYHMTMLEMTTVIQEALALEGDVRQEEDRTHALRQFVRVLKSAGEILFALGGRQDPQRLYAQALALAEGDADAQSQAMAIRQLQERLTV